MARLIREGEGPPLVRKEISSQDPANVISSQPSPMVIRERGKLLFHMVNMFLQHTDSFYIALFIQLYILMDRMGPFTPDSRPSDTIVSASKKSLNRSS
jgi:hypothetical protein